MVPSLVASLQGPPWSWRELCRRELGTGWFALPGSGSGTSHDTALELNPHQVAEVWPGRFGILGCWGLVKSFVEPLPFPGGGEQETRGEFAARQHEQAWGCGFQERPLPWGGWCPPTSSSQLGLASSSTRGQIVSSKLLSTRTQVATVCLLLRVWAEALVPTSQPGGLGRGGGTGLSQ